MISSNGTPMTSFSSTYSLSTEAKQFGLFGNFTDDDLLLDQIRCVSSVVNAESPPSFSDVEKILLLLDKLPFAGRNALASQVLGRSPHRDSLLRQFFDTCLLKEGGEDESDDEFVVLLSDSTRLLDTGKYHVFQVVMILLRTCSPTVTIDICRQYLSSASTRHQGFILSFCAQQSPTNFPNDELYKFYAESPEKVQKDVLKAAKSLSVEVPVEELGLEGNPAPTRQDFFLRILEQERQKEHEEGLIFCCSSKHVEAHLDVEFVKKNGMKRWSNHALVYLNFMRNMLLKKCSPFERARLWLDVFQPALPSHHRNGLSAGHISSLRDLLVECKVLTFRSDVPANVRLYVEEMAMKRDDLTRYEDVVKPIVLDSALIDMIPYKFEESSSDWKSFKEHEHLVNVRHLPFQQAFEQASPVDLWKLLTDQLPKHKSAANFWKYFATTDFTGSKFRAFTIDAIWAWKDLFIRSSPDKLTQAQRQQFASALRVTDKAKISTALWRLWYKSLTRLYLTNGLMAATTERVLQAADRHRGQERSPMTLDIRYGNVLLDIAVEGIQTLPAKVAQDVCDSSKMVEDLRTLLGLFGWLCQFNGLQVVAEMNRKLETVATEHMVPRLVQLLCFDPTQRDKYVSISSVKAWKSSAAWLASQACQQPVSRAVLKSVLETLLETVFKAATAKNHHIALPNGLSRFDTMVVEVEEMVGDEMIKKDLTNFVYYQASLHKQVLHHGCDILEDILVRTKHIITLREEQEHAWKLLFRHTTHFDKDRLERDELHLAKYLQLCLKVLPQCLLEQEKPSITKRSVACAKALRDKILCEDSVDAIAKRALVQRSIRPFVEPLNTLDLLERVLQQVVDETDQEAALLQTNDFKYSVVRHHVKGKTADMDGDVRACGHFEWLDAAFASANLSFMADAMEYTVGRIKNEAGLYRRQTFDAIAGFDGFLETAIATSLDQVENPDSSELVKKLSVTLVSMLQNDLARRDSIGRFGCFANVAKRVVEKVINHDSSQLDNPKSPQLKQIRQLWISFAVEIHWMQTQAESGKEGLQRYRWKGPFFVPSSTKISSPAFDKAYPRHQSINQLSKLRLKVDIFQLCVDDLEALLGPAELIACLSSALEAVWDPQFACGPLCYTSQWCPKDHEVRTALEDRLLVLIKTAQLAWEEVPVITDAFDKAFEQFQDAPFYHFQFSSALLQGVLELYGGNKSFESDSLFYEVPRLAEAVRKVFSYAVQHSLTEDIGNWYAAWCIQSLKQGRRDWSGFTSGPDARLLSFLAKYAMNCEPPSCIMLSDKFDLYNRKAGLACQLLELSKSAIKLHEVKDALASVRQDKVERILKEGQATDFNGPFISPGNSYPPEPAKLLYHWLEPRTLSSFPPSVSYCYADHALRLSCDPDASLDARVTAIENFVAAPTTGHREVMRALQTDKMDEPIREAIIVKVFSLDSPWHVVSHLLNSSLNDKTQQRMTASLLGHVNKYVPVNKVVQLLGSLLAEKHRVKLGGQLHKAIIRMLFDNRTPETAKLLQAEWDQAELPAQIRHILLEKCVEKVVTNEPGETNWEWSILESIAKQPLNQVPKELLILLFSPRWKDCGLRSIEQTDGIYLDSDETLVFFQNSASLGSLHLTSQDTRTRYIALLESLQEVLPNQAWRVLAKLQRLTFLVNGAQVESEEDASNTAVDEIMGFLLDTGNHKEWMPVDQFFLRTTSAILGIVCGYRLRRDQRLHPEIAFKDICQANSTAKMVTYVAGQYLAYLLDTPIRKAALRHRFGVALQCLRQNLTSASECGHEAWRWLVEEPFKSELLFLSADGILIDQALSRKRAIGIETQPNKRSRMWDC